ncbi:hypothetical protein ASF08_10525 [Methylobacterium sp. Leaf85]|nr:hypothetical protein ASF08_10525 [Methylobacterium sp. Leaf85]
MPVQRFAISYLRFSHARQAKGDSVRRQLKACDDYVREQGLTLLDTYSDKGVSGYRGKHAKSGALGALLELMKDSKLPRDFTLIIENLDRLSREQPYDALERFTHLISHGVTIVCLDFKDKPLNRETINKDGSLMTTVLMMLQRGHNESATKSSRVRASYDARFEKAREDGLAMKGFRGPAWLKVEGKRYVEDTPRCDVVREIFRLRIAGLGDYAIAAQLNEREIPIFDHCAKRTTPTKNAGWYPAYISAILESRAVLGEFDPREEGRPFVYFPQVVSPATFADAQAMRRTRPTSVKGARGTRHHNLFMGLLRCKHCGGTMTVTQNRPEHGPRPTIRYLLCSNRRRHSKACNGAGMLNLFRLEKTILDFLPRIPWGEIVRAENPGDPLGPLDLKISALRDDLARYREQTDNLTAAMAQSTRTLPALLKALEDATDKVDLAEAQLKVLKSERTAKAQLYRPNMVKDAVGFVEAMRDATGADRYEARARLSKALAKIITDIECDTVQKTAKVRISKSYVLLLAPNETDGAVAVIEGLPSNEDTARIVDELPPGVFVPKGIGKSPGIHIIGATAVDVP